MPGALLAIESMFAGTLTQGFRLGQPEKKFARFFEIAMIFKLGFSLWA
jgi:hypothetical protein